MLSLINETAFAEATFTSVQTFDVLSYHDVIDNVDGDLELETTTISTKNLARHFAWLQAHDYHPVSINDLLDAKLGKKLGGKFISAVISMLGSGHAIINFKAVIPFKLLLITNQPRGI